MLVSAPTASGKTLIATMAILGHLASRSGRVFYLSPLKALAAEKYGELRRIREVPELKGVRVLISTGDFDARDTAVSRGDIVVMTNEKMDSAIRHDPGLVDEIGLVVADEAHLLGDWDRGPTLEMILSKLRHAGGRAQVLALSATVSNADEIAQWLGVSLVSSYWRPVPLTEGVYDGGEVTMQDGRTFSVPATIRSPPVDIAVHSAASGGQSLIFAPTRPRSVSMAVKAASAVYPLLSKDDTTHLQKAARSILENNAKTETVRTLADIVQSGVAFHHAGLSQHCRDAIETEFRRGAIKLLVSTPTLAAGVNLPARRVVISSIMRYDFRLGVNAPISVMEYKQFCGRAGRPQYDEHGEAITVGSYGADEIMDVYINGKPEPIESRIIDGRSLRIHVLNLVSTTPGIKGDEVHDFFLNTLGGVQSCPEDVRYGVQQALDLLKHDGFVVTKGSRYAATKLGKKVSLLYIDPATATLMLEALATQSLQQGRTLQAATGTTTRARHTLGFLHLISECDEFYPKLGLRRSDYETADEAITEHEEELIQYITADGCSRSFLALYYWITERSDLAISDAFNVESGDMRRMVESADWLVHSLRELAKLQGRADLFGELNILRQRIAYGIKEELVDLVAVRGIGRIRARRLFRGGVRSREDLKRIPTLRLATIDKIGNATAVSIKSQLGAAS